MFYRLYSFDMLKKTSIFALYFAKILQVVMYQCFQRIFLFFFFLPVSLTLSAKIVTVSISDADRWSYGDMMAYSGDTVRFESPMFVMNNYYSDRLIIAPRRIYSPTNQFLPGSDEMLELQSLNSKAQVTLYGVSEYHRMAERISGLTVKVIASNQWQFISADGWTGTREDLMVPPSVDGDSIHNLLVCIWNLEYYLVENFGTGFGPENQAQHNEQRTKILKALRQINADIYGFCEIEQGQSALRELADSLGSNYTFINDGGTPFSSYVKVGYVYDSTKVEPVGPLQNNNTGVSQRKKMITFREKSSGESFIFSLNHFKAKGSGGTGLDADQHDGQGGFNASRVAESKSVIEMYNTYSRLVGESDILIAGDLNSYAKEDPITTFTDRGYIDLHQAFHADSSYSYSYHGVLGYLDHALANRSMARQVTGMSAWHINSPEHNMFHYEDPTVTDLSMFRASDHDPILVGLRLCSQNTQVKDVVLDNVSVLYDAAQPVLHGAEGGYCRIYNVSGVLIDAGYIDSDYYTLPDLQGGFYIVDVFLNSVRTQFKLILK